MCDEARSEWSSNLRQFRQFTRHFNRPSLWRRWRIRELLHRNSLLFVYIKNLGSVGKKIYFRVCKNDENVRQIYVTCLQQLQFIQLIFLFQSKKFQISIIIFVVVVNLCLLTLTNYLLELILFIRKKNICELLEKRIF